MKCHVKAIGKLKSTIKTMFFVSKLSPNTVVLYTVRRKVSLVAQW